MKSEQAPLNVQEWFGFLSFDVMGEFSFAASFNMVKTGKWDRGIKLVQDGMAMLGPVSPTPWLAQIGTRIPGVLSSWKSMIKWCSDTMKVRLEVSTETEMN